jgi:hypothetical protein
VPSAATQKTECPAVVSADLQDSRRDRDSARLKTGDSETVLVEAPRNRRSCNHQPCLTPDVVPHVAYHVPPPPTPLSAPVITINTPANGRHIPLAVTVSGTVTNLRPDQMVFIYDEPAPNGTGTGIFFPLLGPCPVGQDGIWTCTDYVGNAGDFGNEFYVWAALVTSSEAYTDNQRAVQGGGSAVGYAGDAAPPSTGGAQAVAKRLVIRCLQHEQCPSS